MALTLSPYTSTITYPYTVPGSNHTTVFTLSNDDTAPVVVDRIWMAPAANSLTWIDTSLLPYEVVVPAEGSVDLYVRTQWFLGDTASPTFGVSSSLAGVWANSTLGLPECSIP